LIEEPGNSPTAALGTVLEQTPAPNTTMVTGSVLFVKVK
jgi:beta-lactam-binding protein with PASTA domain